MVIPILIEIWPAVYLTVGRCSCATCAVIVTLAGRDRNRQHPTIPTARLASRLTVRSFSNAWSVLTKPDGTKPFVVCRRTGGLVDRKLKYRHSNPISGYVNSASAGLTVITCPRSSPLIAGHNSSRPESPKTSSFRQYDHEAAGNGGSIKLHCAHLQAPNKARDWFLRDNRQNSIHYDIPSTAGLYA
jgi:hypothetical protein